jgi:hypothetical protein
MLHPSTIASRFRIRQLSVYHLNITQTRTHPNTINIKIIIDQDVRYKETSRFFYAAPLTPAFQ